MEGFFNLDINFGRTSTAYFSLIAEKREYKDTFHRRNCSVRNLRVHGGFQKLAYFTIHLNTFRDNKSNKYREKVLTYNLGFCPDEGKIVIHIYIYIYIYININTTLYIYNV